MRELGKPSGFLFSLWKPSDSCYIWLAEAILSIMVSLLSLLSGKKVHQPAWTKTPTSPEPSHPITTATLPSRSRPTSRFISSNSRSSGRLWDVPEDRNSGELNRKANPGLHGDHPTPLSETDLISETKSLNDVEEPEDLETMGSEGRRRMPQLSEDEFKCIDAQQLTPRCR